MGLGVGVADASAGLIIRALAATLASLAFSAASFSCALAAASASLAFSAASFSCALVATSAILARSAAILLRLHGGLGELGLFGRRPAAFVAASAIFAFCAATFSSTLSTAADTAALARERSGSRAAGSAAALTAVSDSFFVRLAVRQDQKLLQRI